MLVVAPAAAPAPRARASDNSCGLSPYQKSLLPPSMLALLSSARAPSPADAPPILVPHTASPPRRKHGSRLQAAAKQQLSSQSRLPLKRKLEQQLGHSAHASPMRGSSAVPLNATASLAAAPAATTPCTSPVRLTAAVTASSSPHAPFSMTMLRPPTVAASVAVETTAPGGTGSTPNKRHRLDTDGLLPRFQTIQPPPSTSTPSRSSSAAAASSSSPAASPPRPFYSMPAHPLTPAELFAHRRSPSPSPPPPSVRPAPRSGSNSSRPSPSKKSLFGASLPCAGGSGGARKRLRDAAALTPGLHHSKGIHCFTLGEDTADDRAKKALAHRQYDEWMDSRRKAEANKKREEARALREKDPHRFRLHHPLHEEEQLESDEEIELMITGRIKAANAAAALPAAAAAAAASPSTAVAAVAATTTSPVLTASFSAVLPVEATVVSSPSVFAPSSLAAVTVTASAVPLPLPLLASSLVPLVPFCAFPAALLLPSSSAAVAMNAVTLTSSLPVTAALVDEDSAVYRLAPFQPPTALVAAPHPL